MARSMLSQINRFSSNSRSGMVDQSRNAKEANTANKIICKAVGFKEVKASVKEMLKVWLTLSSSSSFCRPQTMGNPDQSQPVGIKTSRPITQGSEAAIKVQGSRELESARLAEHRQSMKLTAQIRLTL